MSDGLTGVEKDIVGVECEAVRTEACTDLVGKKDENCSLACEEIQLIDENGEKIELITQEAEGDFDTGDETDEDHEFTVVVEENDAGEVTNITGDIGQNNVIEADSIEDIIAQFEHETSNGPQSKTKQQEAKEIENDLIRRKRNIDLIAKETALLGRKPIEPEKYYNLPVDDEDEDEEERDLEDDEEYSPSPQKIQKAEAKSNVLEEDSSEEEQAVVKEGVVGDGEEGQELGNLLTGQGDVRVKTETGLLEEIEIKTEEQGALSEVNTSE